MLFSPAYPYIGYSDDFLFRGTFQQNQGEKLSGVSSEIDDILGLKADIEQLPTEELYFAYLLHGSAGVYGAKNPPSENLNDLLADRAVKDWLKNFKADKWTFKKKTT